MKIFVVANNYAPYNKEGHEALLTEEGKGMEAGRNGADGNVTPTVLLKADSSLLKNGKPFFIPDALGDIGYGCGLVVRICRLGKTVPARFAHRYYDAVTVGIDFTAVTLLRKLRAASLPWDLAKSFDGAAAIGRWVPISQTGDPAMLRFRLDINGQTRLTASAANLLTGIDETVSYVSRFFTLKTGDLLFTGTPGFIGPAREDDHVQGYIEGVGEEPVLDFLCK